MEQIVYPIKWENRNYIPDSVYNICGEFTQDCSVCSNETFSRVLNTYVHDSQRGKVFCPFGKNGSMNQTIFGDQGSLNKSNINLNNNYPRTTFGHAPQLNPRPLSKIGLEWRTS
jgi:hypothetical protein